jgi:hypothetical protein
MWTNAALADMSALSINAFASLVRGHYCELVAAFCFAHILQFQRNSILQFQRELEEPPWRSSFEFHFDFTKGLVRSS